MFYAVIDTNVLVSALLAYRKRSQSNPWRVMEYVFSGVVTPVYSEEILEEYTDVLCRKKFHFDTATVEKLISEIKRIGISQTAIETGEDFPDPDDAVFFEVAMAEKKEQEDSYLVTGNIKHFPVNPIVTTPAQFVALIELYFNMGEEDS